MTKKRKLIKIRCDMINAHCKIHVVTQRTFTCPLKSEDQNKIQNSLISRDVS